MSVVTLLDIGHCQRTARMSGRAMEAENPFINCVRGSVRGRTGRKREKRRERAARPKLDSCVQPGQQPKIAPRPDKIPLTLSASCAVPYEKPYFARLYRARHPRLHSRTPTSSCYEPCSTTPPTTATTTTTTMAVVVDRRRYIAVLSFLPLNGDVRYIRIITRSEICVEALTIRSY